MNTAGAHHDFTPGDLALIDKRPLSTNLLHAQDEDEVTAREAISNLLSTLQTHPVARRLQRPINGQLASIYASLQSDDFGLTPFTPLTTLIASKASDVEIWQAVLDLITTLSRSSPVPLKSIPPSFNGTPRSRSSASFRDSEQTREELREPLRQELAGNTYINVQGFFVKHFENKSWSPSIDDICSQAVKDAKVRDFPNTAQPEELEVWNWLDGFQKKYLSQAQSVYYRSKSKAAIKGAQGQRQLDIILKSRTAPDKEPHSMRDIDVIGELTKSPKDVWKKKFLQIATYVRDVFAAQPTRWFVHGFLMFGSQMELWVFDRSGAYGSETFDVHEYPERFVRVIAGYAMMRNDDLGKSRTVKHNGSCMSVTITDEITHKNLDLELELTPIVSQAAIVSRGTTCYRTHDGSKVVKLSWRSDKQHSEVDLLRVAQGLKGIPRLVGTRNVTTIEELRSDLEIKINRKLGEVAPERPSTPTSSVTSQSTHAIAKLEVSGTKRTPDATDSNYGRSSKRRRSSHMSNLRQEVRMDDRGSKTPDQASDRVGSPSPQLSSYRNRVLTCIAIAPAGRPLQHFHSILEVLQAFRDAIKAHRSLFIERNILHRDISINNIILADPSQNNGCTGLLIDLDLAVLVGDDGRNETSEEKNMTGTLEYMALQILGNAIKEETAGIEHTYRHDLESFFYVFLSLCIRYGWPSDTKEKPHLLRKWYEGSIFEIYRAKTADVTPYFFESVVLPKFSPTFEEFRPLAGRLRDILFSKDKLFVETPTEPDTLYGPMIGAFEAAIRDVKCRQQGLRSRSAPETTSYTGRLRRPNMKDLTDHPDGIWRKRKAQTSEVQTKRRRSD